MAVPEKVIGKKIWAIAEGYIPTYSADDSREFTSHETACILNASYQEAHIKVYIYFSDREPAGPYHLTVEPQRTKHIRFNDLRDPEIIPKGVDYSSVIESSVPVVVQHSRLDSRKEKNALLTTVAYAQ